MGVQASEFNHMSKADMELANGGAGFPGAEWAEADPEVT
jgi:hypothetical protein